VYFGNSPSAIGGHLETDLRCDAAAPRVETVRFPRARPGRYRIGVDFAKACSPRGEQGVVFAVSALSSDGERLGAASAAIRPGEFLTIALEVHVESGE